MFPSPPQRDDDARSLSGKVADSQRAFHVLETALHLCSTAAVERKDSVQTLRQLIGEAALCSPDSKGRTAIHCAAKNGNKPQYLAALLLLLDATRGSQCVTALQQTKDGKTPLMLAASRGQHLAIRALLDAADVAMSFGHVTSHEVVSAADAALWIAASTDAGGVRCVRELLAWGAGAALQGPLETKVAEVLQRGLIIPNLAGRLHVPCPLVDQRGCTALLLAVKFENVEAVEALLDAGLWREVVDDYEYINTGAGDEAGTSALYVAVSRGNVELVELLLNHQASLQFVGQEKRERWPRTPLSRACMLGHVECAKVLMERSDGAKSLNQAATHRRTPLMEAVWHLQVDLVQLLVSKPSLDARLAEDDGGTALHKAVYWGRGRSGSCADHDRATYCGVSYPSYGGAIGQLGTRRPRRLHCSLPCRCL